LLDRALARLSLEFMDTSEAPTGAPARKRGRPLDTDLKKDERLFDSWKSGRFKVYADCAKDNGITERDLKLAIDRHEKRLPKGVCQER
jgi:hypothetical protein